MAHLCSEHDGCYYDPLDTLEVKQKMANTILYIKLLWYSSGSKENEKLDNVVTSTRPLSDIKKLSLSYQTSSLEAYYSVVNHFAPKQSAFCYRILLLHSY